MCLESLKALDDFLAGITTLYNTCSICATQHATINLTHILLYSVKCYYCVIFDRYKRAYPKAYAREMSRYTSSGLFPNFLDTSSVPYVIIVRSVHNFVGRRKQRRFRCAYISLVSSAPSRGKENPAYGPEE